MHKKLYKIIITTITLFLLSVFLFAFINILSMKANIQREIGAYSKMMMVQGVRPEQITATLNAVRTGREKDIGSNTIQLVSIIILAITAGILLWYSYETKRLADLTAKQIKINIKPIIIVNSISSYCRLKNIGKSPALNITVRDVVRTDNNSNKQYIFKFTEIPVCGSEEERGAGITPYCNGNPITASGDADKLITYFLHYNSLAQGQDL